MKTANDGSAVAPAASSDEFVSRKLIRPAMAPNNRTAPAVSEKRAEERQRTAHSQQTAAGEQTHAETFYYQKQIQVRTPLTFMLRNGESIEGILEWYDKHALRVSRRDGSNLLIYKAAIKYMYKTSEAKQ
jgi:sRNA-binding regulator protein Hfq